MPLSADQASGGSGYFLPLLLVLMFVAMYFLMIRPQQKRRREAERMQKQIGVGDEVVTIGGLYGIVVDYDDDTVTLEIDDDVTARYARQAMGRVVNRASDADADAEADTEVDEPAAAAAEPVDTEPDKSDEVDRAALFAAILDVAYRRRTVRYATAGTCRP